MSKITIVYDNRLAQADLYPGWGFSALHAGLTVVYPGSFSPKFRQRIENAKAIPLPLNEPVEFSPGFRSTGELGDEIKEESLIVDGKDGLVLITGLRRVTAPEIERLKSSLIGLVRRSSPSRQGL